MVEVALRPRSVTGALTEWQRGLDKSILFAALCLIGIGLLLSLAASPAAAARLEYSDPFYFVKRQSMFAMTACLLLLGTSCLDTIGARRLAALVFMGTLVLLAVILVSGHEAKGGQRWIRIGAFGLQPSEFAKPALIVLTGWLLAQRAAYPNGPWVTITLVFFCVTLGFFLLQPDIGQSALLSAAFMITFFVSGLPLHWAALFAGGGAALSGLLYAVIPHVRLRVNSFIDPSAYDTYQVDKAGEAIARGGLFGAGPGEGTIKTSLPDAHNDFIYAVLGEEFGYFAALGLILLFGFIVWKGLRTAARLHDPYSRASATGLFSLFGLQSTIHIGVNLKLIPPTGMTLPFVSYGGSSLLGTALTLGLALALIRRGQANWRR